MAQLALGVSAHLGDLFRPHSVLFHEAARGVGAIGREFPVRVRLRRSEGLGVGMAFNQQIVGEFAHFLGKT